MKQQCCYCKLELIFVNQNKAEIKENMKMLPEILKKIRNVTSLSCSKIAKN